MPGASLHGHWFRNGATYPLLGWCFGILLRAASAFWVISFWNITGHPDVRIQIRFPRASIWWHVPEMHPAGNC